MHWDYLLYIFRFKKRFVIIAFTFFVFILIYLRESIRDWILVWGDNLVYSRNSPKYIWSKSDHISVFIDQLMKAPGLLPTSLLWAMTFLLFLSTMGRKNYKVLISIIYLNLASLIILSTTYVWSHHIANFLLPSVFNIVFGVPNLVKPIKSLLPPLERLGVLVLSLAFVLAPTFNAFEFAGLRTPTLNKDFIRVTEIPSSWEKETKDRINYAYLGRSETGPFPGVVMPSTTNLRCPDTFIFSFFRERAIRQFDCSKSADMIFVSNKLQKDKNFIENFQELSNGRGTQAFSGHFELVKGEWYGWSMWVKINN
jgi:hypothetical protein